MGEQVTQSLSEAVDNATTGVRLFYFEPSAFDVVRSATVSEYDRTELFAQMARLNALYMVARAGSGHLGSSFSSLDIVTWLFLCEMQPGDRYFSSKGHDSPGLYAVQIAMGIIPFDRLHLLRRFGGLPGHPDVATPGSLTNTGSLGMGVSKAKGFLVADDILGRSDGRIFVLTGDGELQEGQFWESLLGASRHRDGRLTVIVDHNRIQSDTYVARVSDLGDLSEKFRAFGWQVVVCNGHDVRELEQVLRAPVVDGRPRAIIANTIKGRGVSFMEHTAMPESQEYYRYHSGAPTSEDYRIAVRELLGDIEQRARRIGVAAPSVSDVVVAPAQVPERIERIVPAYGEAILEAGRANSCLLALDADLVLDTGLIPFKQALPRQFVECGIAEQDMVSQAGTMALSGLLPVVHSFACFLTTRAHEQIYNNCTERTKILYVGSLAGVLPGGPGHSHQSVHDIGNMAGMPGMIVIEPFCAVQVRAALRWALEMNSASTYLRLTSVPYEALPELVAQGPFIEGRGQVLHQGKGVTVVTAGPIMTVEAIKAARRLALEGRHIQVVATPWMNRMNLDWMRTVLDSSSTVITVENHSVDFGFGSFIATQLATSGLLKGRTFIMEGVRGIPMCGRNDEVLAYQGLDEQGLARKIQQILEGR